MGSIARRLLTNFSKGELSPLLEGRPDLAAYFEGASQLRNFYLLRQGGITRRPGTRFIAEVKDSTRETILIPFVPDLANARVIEFGHEYMRFYGNKQRLEVAGVPTELVSPYSETQIRDVHFTQSVDVMYMFHKDIAPRKLARVSDTSWSLLQPAFDPPPSFEDDFDISGGTATLTPGATSGTGVTFTASSAVFLAADAGRLIVFGTARAVITSVDVGLAQVTADILDPFPDTNPIPAGSWKLRLSPQTTLDPDKRAPVGVQVTLVAAANAFRAADVGKFITIYGGLVRIDVVTSATQVKGELLSEMGGTELDNPAATPAWTLEVPSWSTTNGFPRTGDFVQGRLTLASTPRQPTNFWMSQSDDYENFAIGVKASDAIDHTIASRQLGPIQWVIENIDMFLGTEGAELKVTSGAEDRPLGGDTIPLVITQTREGSANNQPIIVSRRIIFVDLSTKKIYSIAFSIEEDGFDALEITAAAEHITESGIRAGHLAFAKRPDPRIFFVRQDGKLVTLTYHHHEKVIGFTALETDGFFESVAVIPQPAGASDQVWVVVRRVINGQIKRYIEVLDDNASELGARKWTSFQTDCAKAYNLNGVDTTKLTGLTHLEGREVDVIADGAWRGTKTVFQGEIVLQDIASQHVEVGLRYDSNGATMRPAIEGQMVEGLTRSWKRVWLRVKDTIGGVVNQKPLTYKPSPLNTLDLYTGDLEITDYGHSTDGRITFNQVHPYPMTILAVFGEIEFSDA